jgi:hypothetical protein
VFEASIPEHLDTHSVELVTHEEAMTVARGRDAARARRRGTPARSPRRPTRARLAMTSVRACPARMGDLQLVRHRNTAAHDGAQPSTYVHVASTSPTTPGGGRDPESPGSPRFTGMSLAACARPGPRFAAATRLKITASTQDWYLVGTRPDHRATYDPAKRPRVTGLCV